MRRELRSSIERWPLARPFRIARGVREIAEVVTVELRDGDARGRGESVPYARYGETSASVVDQIDGIKGAFSNGLAKSDLAALLPPGAARNAVDCAFWDLESSLSGRSVAEALGHSPLAPLVTAVTIGIDSPERMAAEAARLSKYPLLKVKTDARAPEACLRAVRNGAPTSQLIVDANESWSMSLLDELQPLLRDLDVRFVEQPLPAGEDGRLSDLKTLVPNCADESCHCADDLDRLLCAYEIVNIKLDKTGGLTEALRTLKAARARNFDVMVGCMISTSLSIAPAFHVAMLADFVDLDGPLWLEHDRPQGVSVSGGWLEPFGSAFWGNADS